MNLESSCEVEQSGVDTVADESTSWTLACSLSSILTMNCRSKAEAFAKRLHTRLKSLGGEVATDEHDLLQKDTCEVVNDSLCGNGRPVTVGFSRSGDLLFVKDKQDIQDETCDENGEGSPSDSDVFYEFGLESPQSPIDSDYTLNPDDNLFFEPVSVQMKSASPAPEEPPAVQAGPESGFTFCTPTDNLSPECDSKQVTEESEISEYFDPDSISDQISCASLSLDPPDLPREDSTGCTAGEETLAPVRTGSGRRSRFSKRRWGEQAPSPDLAQGQADRSNQCKENDVCASLTASSESKEERNDLKTELTAEPLIRDTMRPVNETLDPSIVDNDLATITNNPSVLNDNTAVANGPSIVVTDSSEFSKGTTESSLLSKSSDNDFAPRNKIETMFHKSDPDDDEKFVWRKSKSLKSFKTPPGTPGSKKIVRFADVLGLDLEDVRTFLDEVPVVPPSAFSHLKETAPSDGEAPVKYETVPVKKSIKCLIPMFQQPGGSLDFMDRVKNQKVSLENAVMMDDMVVKGVIRVLNVDYHKSVFLRYTLDNWRTYHDLYGSYIQGSCDGYSDKFQFSLYAAHYLDVGQTLEFSICYQTLGQRFWDNNYGLNYSFKCYSNNNIGNSSFKGA